MIDADPLFIDPASCELALSDASPCIDSGDPTVTDGRCCQEDRYGNVRVLDGLLDNEKRIDMGGHEFAHVSLAVSGNWTPGGDVTLDTLVTPNINSAFLFIGLGETSFCHPFGCFCIDFGNAWWFLQWPPFTSQVTIGIPPDAPELTILLQVLGLSATAGNTSNCAQIVIEAP